MSSDAVLLSKNGGVATITLNRPESLNALDIDLAGETLAAVMRCEAEEGVRVVIIGGAGRSFCAGGDVKAMGETLDSSPSGYLKELTLRLHPIIVALHRMSKPVIGRVHGSVAGAGIGLALACDLTVAADTARFSSAWRTGESTSWDSTARLMRNRSGHRWREGQSTLSVDYGRDHLRWQQRDPAQHHGPAGFGPAPRVVGQEGGVCGLPIHPL